jgi:hypothetical protein
MAFRRENSLRYGTVRTHRHQPGLCMDAVASTPVHLPATHPADDEKRTELLLDALKQALAVPGEHRLFRWGRLNGLFPSRSGLPGEAATTAVRDGLLSLVRTETKGKLVVEWVRVTPAGVAFVQDRDSPKAVLRELKDLIGQTRAGIPDWMDQAKSEVATLSLRFEQRASAILTRLDSLAARVEDALRRTEAAPPTLAGGMQQIVPWALPALAYLDGRGGDCPFAELFDALSEPLSIPDFQDGLRRLADNGAVHLNPGAGSDPEFLFVYEGNLVGVVRR